MRIRLTLLGLFAMTALPATRFDDVSFLRQLVEFNQHYNVFYREILGCPEGAANLKDCDPSKGKVNMRELTLVTEQICKVFRCPKGAR